jgi:type II secretory pathway component PulC
MANLANRLTLLLLLVCVGLGALFARELRIVSDAPEVGSGNPRSDAGAQTQRPSALPAALPTKALQVYQEILARPLFIKGRQPPAKPQPAPVREPVKQLRHLLEGVAISRHKRVALLRDPRSREQVSVEEGHIWEGWVVERVLPDRVIFSGEGETQELLLEPDDEQAQTSGAARAGRKP